MTLNTYQSSNERTPSNKARGKFDVTALALLTAKIAFMTHKPDLLNVNEVNVYAPFHTCGKYGSFDHVTLNCQVSNCFAQSSAKQVTNANNFQPRPNHDQHLNSYNPS